MRRLSSLWLVLAVLALCGAAWAAPVTPVPLAGAAVAGDVTEGALRVNTTQGVIECPLQHTDVQISVAGFIARATVTQTFVNPYDAPIEAAYVFPLPHEAAVDHMTMILDKRRVEGVMQKREEARRTYEAAIHAGRTAGLLEQERPNIFTQTVGNIKAKQTVQIEISYIDVLQYDQGAYEMHFPMVVGPRYTAGARDAERITPPVLAPGQRSGHDISLAVQLNAGVAIQDLKVTDHLVTIDKTGDSGAKITLSPQDAIPNKDFILKYAVAGAKPSVALLTYNQGSGDGYFMLMAQPATEDATAKTFPRELVFVVDGSGSMLGAPLEKAKATLREFLKRSRPDDTLQVILFAGKATKVFDAPVPATAENADKAVAAIDNYAGGGTTEMLDAIHAALDAPIDPARVRVAIMLTDGYIGNEDAVIKCVGENTGDQVRFWALGIGAAPNRYLLDGIAKQGGGMAKVVSLKTDPAEVVPEVIDRIHRAQIGNLRLDWNGLQVHDVYPQRIPELYAGRPVIVYGRYSDVGAAKVTLSGNAEGTPVAYPIDIHFAEDGKAKYDVLGPIWARKKIDELTTQMLTEERKGESIAAITKLALDYRIMTKYTSFVAVDDKGGEPETTPTPPKHVDVPAAMPAGVGEKRAPPPSDSHVIFRGSDPSHPHHAKSASMTTGYEEDGLAAGDKFAASPVTTSTEYIGGGGGDPWIIVNAPASAKLVTAIFPDGDAKALRYDAAKDEWRLRFDFPLGTAAGRYAVSVVVVNADGTRAHYTLTYQNLPVGSAIPAQAGGIAAAPGEAVALAVQGSGIVRAVAVLPWGARVPLVAADAAWSARLTVPKDYPAGLHAITVVLLDGAHNRTQITVDLTVR